MDLFLIAHVVSMRCEARWGYDRWFTYDRKTDNTWFKCSKYVGLIGNFYETYREEWVYFLFWWLLKYFKMYFFYILVISSLQKIKHKKYWYLNKCYQLGTLWTLSIVHFLICKWKRNQYKLIWFCFRCHLATYSEPKTKFYLFKKLKPKTIHFQIWESDKTSIIYVHWPSILT